MAEFCIECYIKYLDKNAKKEDLAIYKKPDLCEGYGEYKPTVIRIRTVFPYFLDYWFK